MKKVSIWGIIPPPLGGLSIHIQREAELLDNEGTLDKVFYFNYNSSIYRLCKFKEYVLPIKNRYRYTIIEYFRALFIFIFRNKASIIHFHNSLDGAWMILFINKILRKKIVITIHDQMSIPALPKSFNLTYVFINYLFKNTNIKWIAVNPTIKDQLHNKGVQNTQISIIPAYLRPTEKVGLPKDITDFCQNKSPILSVYAFATNLFNGKDLYGIDLALKLISKLKDEYKSIGLVVCIPGRKDQLMIDQYYQLVKMNNLKDNVLFKLDKIDDCASLWAISDIYLRPTNTDGDSIAVREALDVACLVIASDCVDRPKGCILFADGDIDDLYNKTKMALNRKVEIAAAIPNINDYYSELHKVLFNHEN